MVAYSDTMKQAITVPKPDDVEQLVTVQRTIFIERNQRHKTGEVTTAMAERLRGGDLVVLFPEGTSSDGNRILPFRSALVGAVHHTISDTAHHSRITVQPVSIAYVKFGGITPIT